ncbi:MAG: hypothetical protein ABIQ09_20900 [Jatrophihabitantaceae bacterium]
MRIFEDVDRSDSSPARYAESTAQFYARVGGPYWDSIRHVIETWFSHFCPGSMQDLRGRLRDQDDRQFNGAFFELYLHESLRRAGYQITCHPKLSGTTRRPDFLVSRDGDAFYLEAKTIGGAGDVAQGNRLKTVYDALNRLVSPNFFLSVEVETQGAIDLRTRPLRQHLTHWLAGLDPDEAADLLRIHSSLHQLPCTEWKAAGWHFIFRALPKAADRRGHDPKVRPVGMPGGVYAGFTDDVSPLRAALDDKGSAYGALDIPYVIAIATNTFSSDDFDVLNALYGTFQVQLGTTATGEMVSRGVRAPDGYWFGGHEWLHKNVSAVLIAKNLHPALITRAVPTLWEHPAPNRPIRPPSIWARATEVDGALTVQDPLIAPFDLFGFEHDWPPGEPFPRFNPSQGGAS